MSTSNPLEPFTPFLPSTYNIPVEEDRLNTYLVDRLSNFADVINDKSIGIFTQNTENYSGGKWFYKKTGVTRSGYQSLLYIASFPNIGTATYPLPISQVDSQFVVTMVWGSASKPPTSPGNGDYFSFFSQGNSKVNFTMSDTTLSITTTTNMSAYSGFIVIQYVRNGT